MLTDFSVEPVDIMGVLTIGHVRPVASYAACSILRMLTQWGNPVVISRSLLLLINTRE